MLPFKYNVSSVTNFYEGFATVYDDGFNCGFLNKTGEFVIGNITEKIVDYSYAMISENYASLEKDGKWGLYDKNGNLLIDHIYDDNLFVREERICIEDPETGLEGVLDVNGNIIADFKYDKVFEYSNGMAIYTVVDENDEDYYGFLDSEGNEIIEAVYTGAWNFSKNGTATVEKDGEYFIINKKGEIISNAVTNYIITPFSNDLAGFEDFSELCGYVNLDGQVVIEPIYDDVNEFNEYGTAMVEDTDGKMWLIDTKGNKVTDVGYDEMSRFVNDGLIKVEKDGLFGYIDYNGKVVVEPQYKEAQDFFDGLAVVKKDKLYGYIDTKLEEGKDIVLERQSNILINAYTGDLNMEKIEFMNYALSLAKKSAEEGEVPVGAIIVCDGKIVGEGRNRREIVKNALHHAEIEAINDACKNLGGWRLWHCDMYVTLEPCPMCAGAIINARLKKVTFGAYDEKNGACGSVANLLEGGFSFTPLYEGGYMEDECRTVLADFFRNLRKEKTMAKVKRIFCFFL